VPGVRALARRYLGDSRWRDLSFALFFFLDAWGVTASYTGSYPSVQERMDFAQSFGDDKAIRLFYGVPHDLVTGGGYAAWRVGGTLAIFGAAWGMLAAIKTTRAEEDAGRQELVLSGTFGRRSAFAAALVSAFGWAAILWLAAFLGLLAADLPAGGSAYLALSVISPALVFIGVGAIASQLASTRRLAIELGAGALAVAFVLRVIADTADSFDWLRWATPLGWAEEMRAFAETQPAVLLLPAAATLILLFAAGRIWLRRDVGEGLIATSDAAEPDTRLLSSPTAQALRSERGSLIAWLAGAAAFAVIVGILSDSVTSTNISQSLQEQLEKLGSASVTTASGYLSFVFLFYVLMVSLYACSQIAAARHEEADGRLETLFSLPVGRWSWLGGRLLLAVAGSAAIALTVAFGSWAGAAAARADVSLGDMLAAGANCLPATLLFLSLGALALALAPRASTGITYGVVLVSFVWQLFGSLLDVPSWTLDLSPFHQVALVPEESFKATEALVMLAIAAVAAVAAMRVFARRDLVAS
jgi:ABC-2 type transport system permease protein